DCHVTGVQTCALPIYADKQAAAICDAGDGADAVQVIEQLLETAIEPLAANPDLRTRIMELRRTHEQIIDEYNADELIDAYGVVEIGRASCRESMKNAE